MWPSVCYESLGHVTTDNCQILVLGPLLINRLSIGKYFGHFWIINVSLWECPFVGFVPRPSQHIFSTKQEQKVNKHLPWLEPPVCPDGRPVFPTSKPFSSTNDDKFVVILINRVGPINFIHFIYEDRAVRNSLGATAPREQLKQTTNPNICGSVYKSRAIFRYYVTTGRPDWPAVTLCALWLVENRGGLCGSRDCLPGLRMRISRPGVIILLIPPLFFYIHINIHFYSIQFDEDVLV